MIDSNKDPFKELLLTMDKYEKYKNSLEEEDLSHMLKEIRSIDHINGQSVLKF